MSPPECSSSDLKRNEEPAGKLAEALASVTMQCRHARTKKRTKKKYDQRMQEPEHASPEEERK
jgi:hypothetical protein